MALTLSFHQMANAAHREHNNRNPNAVRNMDHIDSACLQKYSIEIFKRAGRVWTD